MNGLRPRGIRRAAGALALAAAITLPSAGCASVTGFIHKAASVEQTAPAGTLASVPAHGLIGFSTPGLPKSMSALTSLESKTGIHPGIVSWYTGLGTDFNVKMATTASSQGMLPLVDMDSDAIPLADVAGGKYDGFFRNYAYAVKKYGGPVAIDFDHEFNGPWWRWGKKYQTAANFVASWRHMVTIFRRIGASNVIWVWNPNRSDSTTVPLRPWYPGDAWVTWIGLDAYFLSTSDTFDSVFDGTIKELHAFTNRRIFVVETGAIPGPARVPQIKSLFAGLAAHPEFIGFIWFDYAKYLGHGFVIDNDAAALATLRAEGAAYQKT